MNTKSRPRARVPLVLSVFSVLSVLSFAAHAAEIQWQKICIDHGMAEGCSVADVNGDGMLDIISLPSWYRAPWWDERPVHPVATEGELLGNYGQILMDINGDGAPDVISAGWMDDDIFWYENPKTFWYPKTPYTMVSEYTTWTRHVLPRAPAFDAGCEAILAADVDGDGTTDVIPNRRPLGWYELIKSADGKPEFVRHAIDLSGRKDPHWLHGLGVGDINGDGRTDIVTGEGWWEKPKDPRKEPWIEHRDLATSQPGMNHAGIPIIVTDLDGDGDVDLMYGDGHAYGVFWIEQVKEGDARKWVNHAIDKEISQAHSLVWIDIDGDGKKELVTGKRWRGHGDRDPGSFDPMGIYYYKFDPAKKDQPWEKHVISHDDHVGVGMQLQIVDLDGDGDLDVVAPGKTGLFLFKNMTKDVPKKYSEDIFKPRK